MATPDPAPRKKRADVGRAAVVNRLGGMATPDPDLKVVIDRWNAQPDKIRYRRGRAGQYPRNLPKGWKMYEDFSIGKPGAGKFSQAWRKGYRSPLEG